MKHASIVPLIGGETIAQQNVFGTRPEWIASFSPFRSNDSHLLNYYGNQVPYHVIDEGAPTPGRVDAVNTVCPCAGLSSLSQSASGHSAMNEWMFRSAEYILKEVKPRVFWGENAPRLATRLGGPVVDRLRRIGIENGYSFSIFKTKSEAHGLSQVRERTFYFFWQGTRIPILEYTDPKSHETIEETIDLARNAAADDPMSSILTNENTPSQDPFYRYLLEEVHGGISHAQHAASLKRTANVLDSIEADGKHSYERVSQWMDRHGFQKHAARCRRMHAKLESGGNIMRKQVEVPRRIIGAFVGHMPTCLTHHAHDRFLTVRECLSIMKMPLDFQMINPRRNINHVCQNVPVTTAEHPARMVRMFLEGSLPTDEFPDRFLIQDNMRRAFASPNSGSSLETFMN